MTKVAVAPVYGGLPVALHSHLDTAVHSCRGDPDIVHDLVYTNINTRLGASNNNILEAFGMWFEEETSHDQIRFIETFGKVKDKETIFQVSREISFNNHSIFLGPCI